MTIGKTLAAAVAIASLASSPAFAGTATRSASALPTAQKLAPVSQIRAATKTNKKASDLVQTVVVAIIVGGVVVGYATYEIVTDDSGEPVSGQP